MLLERFQNELKDHFHLQPTQTKLLLAVSGGIDSIVLTDLVYKSGFDFTIAHCNFQLRAAESERDENFVRSLETHYNKQVLVKKFYTEDYAAQHKLSIQEAARNLRYQWFEELVNGQLSMVNCQFLIATAHNANDNIETILMHFFRGTGIHGLTGIPSYDKKRKILRPLLFAKREDIFSYAEKNNLQWVEDSSNASNKYTRNFFRLQIIPAIKEVFPNTEDNLLNNLELLKETTILYDRSIELYKKKLIEQKGNEFHIPVLKLKKTDPLNTILWEIIKDFDFTAPQLIEIKKLLDAENGSYVSSVSSRIIKNRNWLIIAPLQTESALHILIEATHKKITFENGLLTIKKTQNLNQKPAADRNTALLNIAEIKFPLLLRKWKQGDYFYPLGMQKKKKLSRFFIDQKLSLTEKEKVWVIESNKKILWVVGYRIDDRFKLTDTTKSVLRLELLIKEK
jgi:tRNA(Ile)-lysidine synthase